MFLHKFTRINYNIYRDMLNCYIFRHVFLIKDQSKATPSCSKQFVAIPEWNDLWSC